MNEELIDKMFEDAVANGYSKDRNSFVNLLNSDTEVFSDMYIKFGQGQMNQDQFRSVITPKKKEPSQVGSQKTPPTSGSKPAQSSGKSFAGSIDYLEPTPKFGEIPTAPKVPGTERVVPTQSKSSSSPKVSQNGNTWQLPGAVSKGVGLNQLDEEDKALNVLSKKPTLKFVEDEDLKAEIRKNPKAWTEKVIEKNPSLKDQTIDGVLPGLMDDEPTIESESKQNLEKAKKLVDYTESYDQDFDNMVKESDSFAGVDIKNDPKKYKDAVLNDYLQYLKVKNGEDSQAYLDVKERVDYYKSLGDKLYNDETYADDLKRFQDLQKESLNKISNNSYAKSIAIQNNYDWDYFSKKSSDLDTRAKLIEKQINELGVQDGKVLSGPQQQKYNNLINEYNQIVEDFSKLSQETNIDDSVIDQMRNVQQQMDNINLSIESIDNEKGVNAESIRKYKAEQAANKKAQEEFYNTEADGNIEALGKGVTIIGQQAASTFVKGIFDIAKMPEIVGEAFGAKGYGWSDKISETADNINSVVDLYSPQLDQANFSNFMKFNSSLGQGLGSVAQFAVAGGSASKFAKGLQLSEKGLEVANKSAQFLAASSTSTAQMYNEYIKLGFTPEEAARYGLGSGIVMGMAEMIVPEDELLKNEIKQTIISSIKSGATRKEAFENALKHISLKSAKAISTSGKEYFEEGVGYLAEAASKQVSSTISGKKIDGIWNVEDFNANAMGGGQVGFILELMKFGSKSGSNSNPFEENIVGYLAENYDKMVDVLSKTHPEDYDKIADRFKKLKDIHDGLKNTPAFNQLSKTDQDHILAQAHAKQVILENIKQSGLDKAAFADQISSIDEDIFQTLNGLRSKDTWVDTSKTKENAIPEPSTEEVLPRQQGATTETGGEPQGMGQSVQGQEVTQEGQEVSQEGVELGKESIPVEVTKLNQETFAEDITPEQKAKVEEQNQKDEDESINEIYDFNDEIKSIGTKEQFKQFLKSLYPIAAFSRIAWHNTKKPELTPREGQYYTNTRKNAEDTYKQDNTFAAIVFGNAPKKASFDEVQQVDTKAVKGEGADIVVTDDLSPAIGADMNYREFVPTSADQVIPIGTKENIEAFKAFVEQQKAPEAAKSATEQKVEPEAQEVTGEMSMKDKEAANRKKIIEHNQKAKENRGTNVKAKDFKTVKKRGQDLKVGDIYLRKINDAVYVFRVLSKLNKSNGQFYNMKVEVLDTGTDYVRQELDPQFNIREFGKKVGEETIDTFKNLSSPYGLNFGEVTVIENFESKKKTEEKAPEVQAAEEVAPEDKSIIDAVETLANAEEAGGSEITKAQKEVAEKLGEEGKKLVEINRNFDKLAEDLGFIKTCIIE